MQKRNPCSSLTFPVELILTQKHTRVNPLLSVLVGELIDQEARYENNRLLAACLVQPLKVFNRMVPLSVDDMLYEDVKSVI